MNRTASSAKKQTDCVEYCSYYQWYVWVYFISSKCFSDLILTVSFRSCECKGPCEPCSFCSTDDNLAVCWQHVTADLVCQSALQGPHVTFTDCCCFYGEGWGMQCALCPPANSGNYPTGNTAGVCGRAPLTFIDLCSLMQLLNMLS